MDCNHPLHVNLAQNGISFGAKSIAKGLITIQIWVDSTKFWKKLSPVSVCQFLGHFSTEQLNRFIWGSNRSPIATQKTFTPRNALSRHTQRNTTEFTNSNLFQKKSLILKKKVDLNRYHFSDKKKLSMQVICKIISMNE